MNHTTLLIAIASMAVVTACCRVLPFLLPPKSRLLTMLSGDHPTVKIAGPALLVGLSVATLTQPVVDSPSWPTLVPYGVGAIITAVVHRWSGNVGLAVVIAILGFSATDYGLSLIPT